jgi:hypothetical protein
MATHPKPPQLAKSFLMVRLAEKGGYAGLLVLASLALGMAGFHWTAGSPWLDAFLNAAMLLGGMGPVGDLTRAAPEAKLFAGLFALYAGLVFLVVTVLLLTPVFHHVLHRVHWERGDPS